MDKQNLMLYFESLNGAVLTFPFNDTTEVYKVGNKMFGLIGEANGFLRINVKGDPDNNYALRSMFDSIIPGYHMNKEHWITLILDESIPDELVQKLITDSYQIVFNKLTKKIRESIVNYIS